MSKTCTSTKYICICSYYIFFFFLASQLAATTTEPNSQLILARSIYVYTFKEIMKLFLLFVFMIAYILMTILFYRASKLFATFPKESRNQNLVTTTTPASVNRTIGNDSLAKSSIKQYDSVIINNLIHNKMYIKNKSHKASPKNKYEHRGVVVKKPVSFISLTT